VLRAIAKDRVIARLVVPPHASDAQCLITRRIDTRSAGIGPPLVFRTAACAAIPIAHWAHRGLVDEASMTSRQRPVVAAFGTGDFTEAFIIDKSG
jgi:hypothetical protein